MITCPECGAKLARNHIAHEHDAAIVRMRDQEKMKFKDIGEKLGFSRANAHRIYKRAKKDS